MDVRQILQKLNPFSPYSAKPAVNYAAALPQPAPIVSRPSYDLTGLGYTYGSYFHVPFRQDNSLLRRIRESVPLLDIAIVWLRLLIGAPLVEADEALKVEIDLFLQNLLVNRVQVGWDNWLQTHIDNALLFGRAHTEIVLNNARDGIFALVEISPEMTALRPTKDQYYLDVVQYAFGGGTPITFDPARTLTTVFDVRSDDPNGTSLLYGIPLIAECYIKMIKSLGESWQRYGTPSVYALWKQPEGFDDPNGEQTAAIMSSVKSQLDSIAQQRANGNIQDLVAAGDFNVGILGAQAHMLEFPDSEQRLMEQICAKTKLPPFLFGLQWAHSERMSTTQAILLNEVIESYQVCLTPSLKAMIQLHLDLQGIRGEFELSWQHTSLQDRMEEMRADWMQAQADQVNIENQQTLWRLGISSPEDMARKFRPEMESLDDAEIRSRLPDLATEPPPQTPTPVPFGAGPGLPPAGPASPTGEGMRSVYTEMVKDEVRGLLERSGNGNGNGKH